MSPGLAHQLFRELQQRENVSLVIEGPQPRPIGFGEPMSTRREAPNDAPHLVQMMGLDAHMMRSRPPLSCTQDRRLPSWVRRAPPSRSRKKRRPLLKASISMRSVREVSVAGSRPLLILRAVLIDEITTAARRFFLPPAEALSEIAPLTVVRHS